jgi:hypothetical protein
VKSRLEARMKKPDAMTRWPNEIADAVLFVASTSPSHSQSSSPRMAGMRGHVGPFSIGIYRTGQFRCENCEEVFLSGVEVFLDTTERGRQESSTGLRNCVDSARLTHLKRKLCPERCAHPYPKRRDQADNADTTEKFSKRAIASNRFRTLRCWCAPVSLLLGGHKSALTFPNRITRR